MWVTAVPLAHLPGPERHCRGAPSAHNRVERIDPVQVLLFSFDLLAFLCRDDDPFALRDRSHVST